MDAMRETASLTARKTGSSDIAISDAADALEQNSALVHLQVDIISDAICPWCWVAKRQFEAALPTLRESFQVSTHWHPFQLNPDMPKDGLDRRAYRSAKFGSWEHSQRLDAQVADTGRQVGLDFHHDRMERTPNTFDAHKLIWLAGQRDVQDAMIEALFRGYFNEGRDLGNPQILADIAEIAGFNRSETLAFLNSEEGTEQVRSAETVARHAGLSGVPTFIVNGQALFSGALRADVMIARIHAAVSAPSMNEASPPHAAR
jgi:predicted DsbA family dithiol-disulfide isomerase